MCLERRNELIDEPNTGELQILDWRAVIAFRLALV